MLIYFLCFLGTMVGLVFFNDLNDPLFFMGLAIIFCTIFSRENHKLIRNISLFRSLLVFLVSFVITIIFALLFIQIEHSLLKCFVIILLLIAMRYLWRILLSKLSYRN